MNRKIYVFQTRISFFEEVSVILEVLDIIGGMSIEEPVENLKGT